MRIKTGSLVSWVGVGLMVVAFYAVPRQASADAPAGRYVVTSTEVQDTQTGLVWQRDASLTSPLNWNAAQTYCALFGRLPSVKELLTLVDESKGSPGPTIDTTAFPTTTGEIYWTSSPEAGTSSPLYVWYVDFTRGNTYTDLASTSHRARCVR